MDFMTIAILKKYVDKAVEAGTGLTPSEVLDLQGTINKLQKSIDNTQAEVADLSKTVSNKVDAVEGKGLSTNDLTDELLEELRFSAPEGIIDTVTINGIELANDDGAVNIPVGSENAFGVVRSSNEENKVTILEDGTMVVNSISFDSVIQGSTSESEVFFVGGNSST